MSAPSIAENQIKARDWWKILASKLRGHYTIRSTCKWLNRRSQKRMMDSQGKNTMFVCNLFLIICIG